MNESQFVFVLLALARRISPSVGTVACVEAKPNSRVGRCVKEPFALLCSFDMGSHVRMKYQIESELLRHVFRVSHNLPNVLPLFCVERRAPCIVSASGKCVALWSLVVCQLQK